MCVLTPYQAVREYIAAAAQPVPVAARDFAFLGQVRCPHRRRASRRRDALAFLNSVAGGTYRAEKIAERERAR
jgi:hypothetical protein